MKEHTEIGTSENFIEITQNNQYGIHLHTVTTGKNIHEFFPQKIEYSQYKREKLHVTIESNKWAIPEALASNQLCR
jgi:hypothetical protein